MHQGGVLTIQSIEYRYPTIEVRFNCPLQVHSAQFTVLATVDAKGALQSIDFEGNFFCPDGGGFSNREHDLAIYAAGTYHGDQAMTAPPNRSMKPSPAGTTQFCWRIFPHSQAIETQLFFVTWRLQKMIDYLQIFSPGVSPDVIREVSEEQLQQTIREYPWIISSVLATRWNFRSEKEKITEAFVQSVLDHYSEENLSYFFKSFFVMIREFPNNSMFIKMRDKLFETEAFWTNPDLVDQSVVFFTMINVDHYKKNPLLGRSQTEALKISPLTEEQKRKIASIIPYLPKLPEKNLSYKQRTQISEREKFLELYSPPS